MASSLAILPSREFPLTNHADSTFSYQVRHFHHYITGWIRSLNEPNKPWKEVTLMTPFPNKDISLEKAQNFIDSYFLTLMPRLLGGCKWCCLCFSRCRDQENTSEPTQIKKSLVNSSNSQSEAIKCAQAIKMSVTDKFSESDLMNAVQKLSKIRWNEVQNPLPVLQDLLSLFTSNKSDLIYGGIKLEVAHFMEACCHLLFKNENILTEHTKEKLRKDIAQAKGHVKQDRFFASPLYFSLDCCDAALDLLADTSAAVKWGDCLEGVIAITIAASGGPLGPAIRSGKKTAGYLISQGKQLYRASWYPQIIYIRALTLLCLETKNPIHLERTSRFSDGQIQYNTNSPQGSKRPLGPLYRSKRARSQQDKQSNHQNKQHFMGLSP